jgi:hypothetical protein
MDMVSLLDDSPGEEIALLIMMLAAATAAEAPQQKAEGQCPSAVIFVSKTVEPGRDRQKAGTIPVDKSDARGPAVLTPECKAEQRKKKDYPMA